MDLWGLIWVLEGYCWVYRGSKCLKRDVIYRITSGFLLFLGILFGLI